MKFALFLLIFTLGAHASDSTIEGKVTIPSGCSKKAMVWLSLDKENYKERLLLMHTEVPQGGTYRFYVKPGDYQVRASDESGCEYMKRVHVKGQQIENIQLVKK
ncbi:hypothetical protein ACJVC5_08880 [Peredibacter sp. HCB2-198]|uniref:hypothetical protein n=1 Tax=Peredibacter sp. HCB2-198 TaxID=3383025 RepID=UPI0038B5ACD6